MCAILTRIGMSEKPECDVCSLDKALDCLRDLHAMCVILAEKQDLCLALKEGPIMVLDGPQNRKF